MPTAREPAIRIRPAASQDCAAIADLARQLGYASSSENIAARLEGFCASAERQVLVAEEANGALAGWIGIGVFHSITNDPRVEVTGLVVAEARRSSGIGELLLKSAEEWARGQRLNAIGLHCNVVRERAHQFYTRYGYSQIKTQTVFQKLLDS